jgi:hypothetical protein
MSLLRPLRPEGSERLGRLRRWAGTRRGTTVLITLALVLALALPTVAQQWVGAGHRMPEAPPDWAIAPATPKPGCRYFPETQHNLCGAFRQYWDTYGGLLTFGYPLTEEYFAPELGHEGHQGVLTQWFERARFEWHPGEIPERFDVLQGHLGREILAMLTAATPTPSRTPTPSPSDYTIDLVPLSATNVVGTTHSVTALVAVRGQPVSGVRVRFSVSGGEPTPRSGLDFTDANGRASFTFTDTKVGTDTILAWIDLDADGVRDSNEPRATANKTWTAGAPAGLDAEPESQAQARGLTAQITVELTDQYGNPVQGRRVRARVTGANSSVGTIECGLTGVNGEAACSYKGTAQGDDTVLVFADTNNDGNPGTTEPQDSVTIKWVTAQGTVQLSSNNNTVQVNNTVNATVTITGSTPPGYATLRFPVVFQLVKAASGDDATFGTTCSPTNVYVRPTTTSGGPSNQAQVPIRGCSNGNGPITVKVFHDTDGNGTVTTDDVQIGSAQNLDVTS